MTVVEILAAGLLAPVRRLFDLADAMSAVSIAAAIAFTLIVHIVLRARRRRRPISLRGFVRFILPRRVLLHASSRLDYKLYVVNSVLLASGLGVFMVGAGEWQAIATAALERLFGPGAVGGTPSWSIFAVTTASQILALDFGYYAAHVLFHRSAFFWEFHKVHHSAEVMTPATELRQHPVELIVFPIVYGVTAGTVYAVMVHLFGPDAQKLGLSGQTMILVAHLATFHHLRHSHVHMPFTGIWGKLLHSPAHHRIHHSSAPEHHDRNMGYLFSIWDWLFGTLWMPAPRERLVLGIGPEGATHTSVRRVFWQPVRQAVRLLRRSGRPVG